MTEEKKLRNIDIYTHCDGCPHLRYCGLSVSCRHCCDSVSDKAKEIYDKRRSKGDSNQGD